MQQYNWKNKFIKIAIKKSSKIELKIKKIR